MTLKFKKGFSLVELLVVIAIIGILAAVGITAYSGYTSSAKVKATLANHAQLVKFISAELAKCAGGDGNFAWGAPDPCVKSDDSGDSSGTLTVGYALGEVNHGSIANYVNATLGMTNPYNVTTGAAAVANAVVGEMVIACDTDECTIVTTHGEGTHPTETIPYM